MFDCCFFVFVFVYVYVFFTHSNGFSFDCFVKESQKISDVESPDRLAPGAHLRSQVIC